MEAGCPNCFAESIAKFTRSHEIKIQFAKEISGSVVERCVEEADDERLRTLIDGDCTSIVARWLVGRNDAKSDALRTELLFDNELIASINRGFLSVAASSTRTCNARTR